MPLLLHFDLTQQVEASDEEGDGSDEEGDGSDEKGDGSDGDGGDVVVVYRKSLNLSKKVTAKVTEVSHASVKA